MELNQFRKELEELGVAHSKEKYKQYAGLEYSEEKMEELAGEEEKLAKKALEEFSQEEVPKILFWSIIGGSISSKLEEIDNEIYKKRMNEITVEKSDGSVDVGSWRTWNSKHLRDYGKRKRVFDSIVSQGDKVVPLVKEGFGLVREKYGEYGLNVLEMYLEREGIGKKELLKLVSNSAKGASGPFEEMADELSREMIGKEMEYYDDLYTYRHVVYKPFDDTFKEINYFDLLNDVFTGMGFDLDQIDIDGEQRKGKTPSPMCSPVQVPNDVRVLFQETTPFGDFTSYCHEMGHALHESSINEDLIYEKRYMVPMGVAETFSTLFESLATDEVFLKKELGVKESQVEEIKKRHRFMELFFLTFYGANSRMKIEYWDRDYSIQQATQRYAELYEGYVGKSMPGKYWLVHHIMPIYSIYCPSYLIANIRKSELRQKLINDYGREWWRSREAGKYLRNELMGPGSEIPLKQFSNMNKDIYLKEVLGK